MILRISVWSWRLGGAVLWIAAVLLPVVRLLTDLATGPAPSEGWGFSERQFILLAKTAGLAGAATLLTLLIGLLVAWWTSRVARGNRDAGGMLIVVLPLLLPPYVYAFGWDGLVSPWMARHLGEWSGWVRAACVWAGWAWPIPALIVSGGWRRVGLAAYQAALLEAEPPQAFRRAVLPILAGHVGAAAVVLWVLFMIEYNVPHACSIQVYATELLSWAQASRHAIDVVWPSLPLLVLLAVVSGIGLVLWRGSAGTDEQQESSPANVDRGRRRRWIPLGLVLGLTVGVPLLGLIGRLSSLHSFVQLWRVYRGEIVESFAIAAAGGIAVVWMGTWLGPGGDRRHARRIAVAGTLLFGLLPAALVGQAMVVAYRGIPIIYDQWPVMVLTQSARWGWIGWLAAWLVGRSTSSVLMDQARADGADPTVAAMTVGWRVHWPILAFAGALAMALGLAEVAAMSMVRPPGIGWIAQTLMETFHRLEDQMLVAISLVLAAALLPALILGRLASGSTRSRHEAPQAR